MGRKDTGELLRFLAPFDAETVETVMWLRDFAWELCPDANELIYDNYNAVAVGWSPTEKVGHTACSVAVGRSSRNIHFGFYHGSELRDPEKLLLGNGNQYRYLLVTNRESFPKAYAKKLVHEAYVNALSKVKDPKLIVHGQTIVKSVSAAKRPAKKQATPPKKKKAGK